MGYIDSRHRREPGSRRSAIGMVAEEVRLHGPVVLYRGISPARDGCNDGGNPERTGANPVVREVPFGAISRAGQYQEEPFFSCFNPCESVAKYGNETLMNNDLGTEISSNAPWMRIDAISTRNCDFQRQVPGNCSDKEPYFSA